MFKNTRLTTILKIMGALIFIMSLISCIISARYLYQANESLKRLNFEVSATLGVADTTNWMRAARITLLSAIPFLKNGDEDSYDDRIRKARYYYNGGLKFMTEYQATPRSHEEDIIAKELAIKFRNYVEQGVDLLFTAMENRNVDEFIFLSETKVAKLDEEYLVPLDKIISMHKLSSKKITINAEHDTCKAYMSISFLLLFIIIAFFAITLILKKLLITPLELAGKVTNAIGQGDLTSIFPKFRNDEIGRVLHGLEKMQKNLAIMINDIKIGTSEVSRVAVQIGEHNQRLSVRTEQQSIALDQTASVMEELSAQVVNNALNADKASDVTSAASEAVYATGIIMNDMVNTMNSISASATEIKEITTVINEIAFQTIILGINAAIEASRAEKGGTGFSVVANEIRTLANRTTQSACKIEKLISTSDANVKIGVNKVATVSLETEKIINNVSGLKDRIEKIAHASNDQSKGIGLVGIAIIEMKKVTQQNASFVKESAVATETLNHQVRMLSSVIERFNITESLTNQNHIDYT